MRDKFIEKQIAYTRKRELKKIEHDLLDFKSYEKKLSELYNQTFHSIKKDVEAAMWKFASDNNISIAEANKVVSAFDVEGFSAKALQYVREKDFSEVANKELKLYNLKMRVSRLEMLKREVNLELIALANEEEAMLRKKLIQDCYDELERQAGILSMSKADQKKLKSYAQSIVDSTFHSTTFSEKIWTNNKELQYQLSKGIQRSVMSGQHPRKWASSLLTSMNEEMLLGKSSALYAANRLAVTESARVRTETAINSFNKMGYQKYIWIAEPTACHICAPYDNEVFELSGSSIGHDLPPMHPWCRCSVAAWMEREGETEVKT